MKEIYFHFYMIQMKVKYFDYLFYVSLFIILKKKLQISYIEIEPLRMIELSLCIIKGIEKIHQIGIAHRDLKTKNVT